MTVASDGAIWLIEDKNQTIIRIDNDPTSAASGAQPCNARTAAQNQQLLAAAVKDRENFARLSEVRTGLIEKHCAGCHSDFGLRNAMNARQKDEALLSFLLSQDGWDCSRQTAIGKPPYAPVGQGRREDHGGQRTRTPGAGSGLSKACRDTGFFVAKLPTGQQKPPAR